MDGPPVVRWPQRQAGRAQGEDALLVNGACWCRRRRPRRAGRYLAPPTGLRERGPSRRNKQNAPPKAAGFPSCSGDSQGEKGRSRSGHFLSDAPSGAPARCRCSRWHPVPSATSLVPTSEPPRSSCSSPWRPRGQHVSQGPGGVSGHRGQLRLPGHPAGPGPPSQGGAWQSGRRRTLAGLSGTAPVPPASASQVGCWRWSRRCPPILCSESCD